MLIIIVSRGEAMMRIGKWQEGKYAFNGLPLTVNNAYVDKLRATISNLANNRFKFERSATHAISMQRDVFVDNGSSLVNPRCKHHMPHHILYAGSDHVVLVGSTERGQARWRWERRNDTANYRSS